MISSKTKLFFRWPLHLHPRVQLAGSFPFGPEFVSGCVYRHPTVALHQHFYKGRLILEGGQTTVLHAGDVTLSLPNVSTQYELDEPGFHWCIHFSPCLVEAPGRSLRLPRHFSPGLAGPYISERMRAIADLHMKAQRIPSDTLLNAAVSLSFQELLTWMAVTIPEQPGVYRSKSELALREIRELLDKRYNESLTVSEIVRGARISRNYLATRFRERFGMTIESYLLRRRIEAAKRLLLTTNLLAKEVAFQVGIPDSQYFNKQFRRITGISPTAFRTATKGGAKW